MEIRVQTEKVKNVDVPRQPFTVPAIECFRPIAELDQRRSIAKRLSTVVADFPGHLSTLKVEEHFVPTYYGFPIMVDEGAPFTRRQICEWLEQHGIETRAMMGGSLPNQPGFRHLRHRIVGELPVTATIRDQAFFIGCHPGITKEGVKHVAKTLQSFAAEIY